MTITNQESEERREDYETFKSGIRGLTARTEDVQEHVDLLRKRQTKVAHGFNADLDTIQDIKEKVRALTSRLNGLEKDCNWSRDFLVEGCRTAERIAPRAGPPVTSDDDATGDFRARRQAEREEKEESKEDMDRYSGISTEEPEYYNLPSRHSDANDDIDDENRDNALDCREDDEEYAENLAREVIREGGREASDELYAADDNYREEMTDDGDDGYRQEDDDYRREAEYRKADDLDADERRYEAASEEEEEAKRDRPDSLVDDDLDEGKTREALSDEELRNRRPSGESLDDDDASRDHRYDDEPYSDEEVVRRAEDDERYSDEE